MTDNKIPSAEDVLKQFGAMPSPFNNAIKLYNSTQVLEAMHEYATLYAEQKLKEFAEKGRGSDNTQERPDFKKALTALLNSYSLENGSNTPDFILAEFLFQALISFNVGVNYRRQWYSQNENK